MRSLLAGTAVISFNEQLAAAIGKAQVMLLDAVTAGICFCRPPVL
jgi:hypothetical protein